MYIYYRWTLVADRVMNPSWDRACNIRFDTPLTMLPRSTCGIYIHSSLPDDLGIQYQSYREGDTVAQSEHLVILTGLGHTGSEPFDTTNVYIYLIIFYKDSLYFIDL